jgi:hypothetical protein
MNKNPTQMPYARILFYFSKIVFLLFVNRNGFKFVMCAVEN